MRILQVLNTIKRSRARQTTAPRFLTYIVTFTCNAKCIMCDSWKKESPDDLSLEEIEGIFRQLPPLDAVRLTGGEPFVRKDLLEIAHLAQRHLKPLFLHVTTNGFLTDKIVRFCEGRDKSIPLEMLISIDGLKEKHNYVRGKETAWDSVMKTLNELAPRRKELGLRLGVNQTIVDADGVEHYKKLRDFLKPLGVHNNVVMAYDASATYTLGTEIAPDQIGKFSTFGEFSDDHLRELMGEIEKDLASFPWRERLAKRYYLRGIRNRLLHDTNSPNPKCVALGAHMRLYPNGDIPVCQFNSKRVGNLRKQSFQDIWFGENKEIEKQREWVRKCPGCWAECEILPSAIYTGDLITKTLFPPRPRSGTQPQGKIVNPKPLAD
jgi:MoaA/NifB/PqqE/SkfB family radical SAM enzyme